MPLLTTTTAPEGVTYPEGDGKPMAETDWHLRWMFRLIELLRRRYAGTQTYVSGNLLLYYVEGNPKKRVSPDVFVVKGIDPHDRRIYKLWEEETAPNVVFEISSKSTTHEDLWEKPRVYDRMGVREYFLFDPLDEYLEPALAGFRRIDGDEPDAGLVRMEMDEQRTLVSEELGLLLRLEGNDLVLIDQQTGERLKTAEECEAEERAARERADDRASAAELALQREHERCQQLEAELAKLRGTTP